MACELLVKNGLLIDGTGKPGFYGNLAVVAGKIAEISSSLDCPAEKIIDASGLTVCPGFIDPHVHEELTVLSCSKFEAYLRQGVTTIISGNCGHSITPYSSDNIYAYMLKQGLLSPQTKARHQREVQAWNDFSGYIEVLKQKGTNLNMGFLLGHGTLRWSVMSDPKKSLPSSSEEDKLIRLLEEGLEQGALGLSTGLTYNPSKYADTDELIKLSKVVRNYDGIYTSHLRNYLGIREAVQEAIKIGAVAGIRVQISHLTPTCPEAFEDLLSARKRGVEIAVDTIPKSSGHFRRKDRLFQYVSPHQSPQTSTEMRKLLKKIRFKEKLSVINTKDPTLENRTLEDIAQNLNLSIEDLILDLLEHEQPTLTFCQGGLNRQDFPGTPYPDVIALNPLVMVGSDRITGDSHDPYAWYELFRQGAFPIFFNLCRQKSVPLEEIIRRLTALPAQQFRLKGRGLLAKGNAADLTILDTNHYTFPANESIDYRNPFTKPSGVYYTIVNGQLVYDQGTLLEVKAGHLLSRSGIRL